MMGDVDKANQVDVYGNNISYKILKFDLYDIYKSLGCK